MLVELANRIRVWVLARLSTKQDTLVSGTNIKTVNNESLLGSGNINLNLTYYTKAEIDAQLGNIQHLLSLI